jgi:hypothetical protein
MRRIALLIPLLFCAIPAKAQDTHFAITTITNRTTDNITYTYWWGDNHVGQGTKTLYPGQKEVHWLAYDFPNQNRSPIFQAQYDADMTAEIRTDVTSCQSKASPYNNDSGGGENYGFVIQGGNVLTLSYEGIN